MRHVNACVYLADEDFDAEQSVFAPFFATQVATLTSLARLVRVANAIVIPIGSVLSEETGGYQIHIGEPFHDFPTGDAVADATRMNQALEAMISLALEQYMWTMRRFRTRPSGAPSPY